MKDYFMKCVDGLFNISIILVEFVGWVFLIVKINILVIY